MKIICFIAILLYSALNLQLAFALDAQDIIKLKEVGVHNTIILELISSKAITRALITVDEIIQLKSAGINENLILSIIRESPSTVPELDKEDAADRTLKRNIKRKEIELDLLKKRLDVSVDHLSKLFANPEIIKLVNDGKISGEDYADIVKHLKQYARDEDSVDYREDRHINIDIKKKVFGAPEKSKKSETYKPHIYIVK